MEWETNSGGVLGEEVNLVSSAGYFEFTELPLPIVLDFCKSKILCYLTAYWTEPLNQE